MKSFRTSACGLLTIATLAAWSPQAHAATVAADDASNYTNFGAFTASNLGAGFGAWTLTGSDTNSSHEGSYLNTASKAISVGTKSWGFYANTATNTMVGERPFTGSLSTGQVFQIDIESDGCNAGTGHSTPPGASNANQFGFELRNGSTSRFRFYFVGGQQQCQFDDSASGSTIGTNIFPSGGMRVAFRLLTVDTYEFTVISPNSGQAIFHSGTRTLGGSGGTGIDRVDLYVNNSSGDTYFNSMKIGYDAPRITAGPSSTTAACSGNPTPAMTVTASSTDGSTLSYAWRKRGTGWGGHSWNITDTPGNGNAGHYLGGPNNQNGQGTNIALLNGTTSWALWSYGSTAQSIANRALPAVLGVNQSFSIDMQNGSISNGAKVGFGLTDTNGTNYVEFQFIGGQNDYTVHDSSSTSRDLGIGFSNEGLNFTFTLTSPTNYTVQVKRYADGETAVTSGTLLSGGLGGIARLYMWNIHAGNNNDVFFNNIFVAGADDNGSNYGGTWATGATDTFGQAPLTDGATGNGSFYVGSATTSFIITNAQTADSTNYDCAVMSGQGYQTNSNASVLTVNATPSSAITAPSGVCPSSTGNLAGVPSAGASATYVWTITGGSITAGSGTSNITFSANASGNVVLDCSITNAAGCFGGGSQNTTIPIGGPSSTITAPSGVCASSTGNTASVPTAGVGATYAWTITGGSITAGSGTTSITFSANASGNVVLNCTVTSGAGCSSGGSQNQTITINSIPSSTITAPSSVCASSTVNTASVPTAGVGATYAWTITGGSITAGTGTTSITFSANASGNVVLNCTVTSGAGCSSGGSQNLTIPINQSPSSTITAPAQVCASSTNSASVPSAGAGSTYAWTITGGTITAGSTTSNITFTAGASGSVVLNCTITSGACTIGGAQNLTIPIPAITLSPASLPFGITNISYSVTNNTITTTGGTGPYTYSVTLGALPAGLALNASTGAIIGTPTTAAMTTFTVTATDAGGCTGSQAYSITIGLPVVITGQPTNITACSGATASFSVTANGSANLAYAWRKNGVGWGAANTWNFNPTACSGPNDGYYVGDSTGGGSLTPGIGTAYGQYAANGNSSEAIRNFSNLQVGQSVVIDYQNPRDMLTNGTGTVPLFALRDSGGTNRFQFYFIGGASDYTINDTNAFDSGIPYTPSGLQLTFTLLTTNTYNLQVTVLTNNTTYTYANRPLGGNANAAISQMRFYYRNSGGGGTIFQDFFYNVLAVGGYSDNAANYSSGACGSTTWTNNSNLGQGPLTDGGSISGSTTPTLQVSNVTGADSGSVYSVIVYNPYGAVKSGTGVLSVNATPTITTGATLPAGTNGVAYSQPLASSGGTGPYTYAVTSGALPTGISLTGGVLTGTPETAAGTYNFTISSSDSSSTLCAGSKAFSLSISCPAMTLLPAALPNISIGAPYNQTVAASGGTTPYTYSVSVGSLPGGLTLGASSGSITGTYTSASGTDVFTIAAIDANGCQVSQVYTTQMITCPPITLSPVSLPGGTAGTSFSQQMTANGGTGPYSFSEVGALPAGVTLSSSGLLSGTPTQVGTFSNIVITAIDSTTGCGGSQAYLLVVGCQTIAVAINGAPAGAICASTPVNLTASSSNTIGLLSYAWTKDSVAFTNTEILTDNPAAGNHTYAVTVTDTNGCSGQQSVSVTVNAGAAISVGPTSQGVCSNSTASFTVTASGSPTYAWQKIGTGWGSPWSFTPVANTGTAGFYIGTSTNAGAGVDAGPGIDSTNHAAFGLYANSGNTAAASRTLNPPLSAGQTFEIDVNNGDEPPAASVGFNLFTGGTGGTQRFEFAFRGGSNDYIIADASGNSVDTGVHYTTQGLHVVLTMTSSSTYTLEIAPKGTNEPLGQPIFLSGTMAGAAGSIDTLRLFNFESAGSIGDPTNPQRDAFFNNIQAGAFDDAALNYTPSNWTNGSDRGDAPLANGATGDGSTIVGADTSSLTISNAGSADAGSYDVVVYNLCGLTNSAQAALAVNPLPTVSVNSATICSGVSTTLTATTSAASPSYLWSLGGATNQSITVSPASTTTYTVTVTDGTTGCVNSGSGTVTVNPLPTVSVNSATICSGVSTTLTATTSAASPSYLWSPGGATTASITVSPASTTTYTVTVTDGVTGCANSDSGTVTVNPLPTVSVNSATICSGVSTTLTATASASSPSYLWSPGGATTQSITVSPASTTTYTVTVTDGTTGCANSGLGTVTVNPLPTASVNSATICSGVSTTLTATSSASSPSYLWSPGGATTQSITVSPASTTTYTVTVTDGTTGCANSGSGTVTVNPAPATPTAGSNSPIHQGDTLNLTAATVPDVTYSWTGPNSFTASTQNPSITNALAAASGAYTVTVTDTNGCTASSSTAALVSVLQITSITSQGGNILITWIGDGGTTNQVQVTPGKPSGDYTNSYTDIGSQLLLPGVGQVTTNYLDMGGATNAPSRYYRIRLVP